MVDGGTEGFKGHARVILPGVTPCFDCTLWLFPPQVTFPLCTLAETPRSPVHCIEYAHLILWEKQRPDERFDADNEEHMQWARLPLLRPALNNVLIVLISSASMRTARCRLNACCATVRVVAKEPAARLQLALRSQCQLCRCLTEPRSVQQNSTSKA